MGSCGPAGVQSGAKALRKNGGDRCPFGVK